MRGVLLSVLASLGYLSVSRGFLLPASTSRPVARTQSRSSSRLYARVTPKQGEQKQDREGEQGLPRLLGSDDAPVVPVIEEGGKPQQIGEMMGAPSDFDGEDWEAKMEAKLQDMYAKGTYDPTPVTQTPEELAKQQWMDDFLNKEERPIQWNFEYWVGTWFRPDVRYASAGRGIKSFSFAVAVIGATALMFLLEDEVLNPILDDYNKWDGNDYFHVLDDLSGWAQAVPARVQDYVAHFDLTEYLAKVATRAGAAPRWQNQLLGLPGGITGDNPLGP